MKKIYPLEIENIGDNTYILMSRGHHDVHEFMKAVRKDDCDWCLGMPTHLWFRAVPTRLAGWSCKYHVAKEGERGAFPVTHCQEAYGEDTYESICEKLKRNYNEK